MDEPHVLQADNPSVTVHVLYCSADIPDLITLDSIRIHLASYPPQPGLFR